MNYKPVDSKMENVILFPAQDSKPVETEPPAAMDIAERRARVFMRHSLYLLMRKAFIPLLLAALLGVMGIVMGYASHQQAYEKVMSVNIGIIPSGMISGREAAVSGLAMLSDISYYEKVRAMLSFPMRLQDLKLAIEITNPIETDVLRFTVHAEAPLKVMELSEAARVIANGILSSMPQIAELTWLDSQNEIRDVSHSQMLQALFYGVLFAAAGVVLGLGISFVLILFDDRIHFADEAEHLVGEKFCALVSARRKKAKGVHRQPERSGGQKITAMPQGFGHGRAVHIHHENPEADSSVLLLAAQLACAAPEAEPGCRLGHSLLLLPTSGNLPLYLGAVTSLALAFQAMQKHVLVINFSDCEAFSDPHNYPLHGVDIVHAANRARTDFNATAERYRHLIAAHDITLVFYGDLAASASTLRFLTYCDAVYPLVYLHKTRMPDFRRLINHLANLRKEASGLIFLSRDPLDFKRNLI